MFLPVKITGDRVEYLPLEEFGTAIRDLQAPLELVGERILQNVGAAFETEGASGNRPWEQLADGYRAWKESKVAGLPILIGVKASGSKGTRNEPKPKTYSRSGRMREELVAPTSVRVANNRLVYMPLSDIAVHHQEGTPRMPARPPVVITFRELAQWDRIFTGWLDGLIRKVTL